MNKDGSKHRKRIVQLARKILSGNKADYPDNLWRSAEFYLKIQNTRLEAALTLLGMKEVRRVAVNNGRGNRNLSISRKAGFVLNRTFSKEVCNTYFKSESTVHDWFVWEDIYAAEFESMFLLFTTQDLDKVLRWYTCVNSQTKDYSLEDVKFMRYISPSNGAEILAFMLNKERIDG